MTNTATNTAPSHPLDKTSPNLTSYDLFKAVAVLLMVVDHIGYYFFPDELWLRVIGRFCVPIWFFLVGYARGRDLSPMIWIGMAALVLASMAVGQSVFPLNVLATMIAIRLVIDPVMRVMVRGDKVFWGIAVLLLLLSFSTYSLTEYGTQGLLLAIFGYIIRHKPEIPGFTAQTTLANAYAMFTIVTFLVMQQLLFNFDSPQFMVLGVGISFICLALMGFRPMEFPQMTKKLPGPACALIKLLGRRTLEIYVLHLILFKILGALWMPERFPFLQWTWFWAI